MPTLPSAARATFDRAFAEMARRGLSRPQKQLEPAFFYDALGSALFEAITRLPEYTITRAELALLEAHGAEIIATVGEPLEFIELGPGNGEKLSALARHAPGATVHLIDVSPAALSDASRVIERACGVRATTFAGTFERGLRALPSRSRRRLVLFLGSNVGNFSPDEARAFLRNIHGALAHGDALLLGADLVKSESALLAAYDDPLGVTAAFNKNILARMNRELGATFDLAAFDHRAVWNASAGRMEMHLVSLVEQSVTIPALELTATFAAGETIWTESSHKYRPPALRELLESAGFSQREVWVHGEHRFSASLFFA